MPLHYDQLAEQYARNRRLHPGVFRSLNERCQLTPASRILEVGCGTGNYIQALEEATGAECWGIDPSEQMLTRAREQGGRVTFARGRAERLDVPPASFDLIFSVDVIHHVTDRSEYFRGAVTALRPGGVLCTATDSPEDIRRRRPLSNYFPETVAVELTRYPSIHELRREMVQAGFSHIDNQRLEFSYALTSIASYRDRAFSALHLIPLDAYQSGLARLTADLRRGPVEVLSLYTLVWGKTAGTRDR